MRTDPVKRVRIFRTMPLAARWGKNTAYYEVKVDGEWVRVPLDTINNVVAPDGGAHVCAPRQEGRNKGVLYCVILPSEG
jgi:hypothetical protein